MNNVREALERIAAYPRSRSEEMSIGTAREIARAALASQAQQPNAWQQAIDDELVNAHLGIAKDGITREEAKAELNKLIAWHIDVAKYFESQAQQTESRHLSIESAPKDGMLFLSWGKHSTIPTLTKYSSEYGWFESEDGVHLYNLVCWMPLPPAPEGDKP